MKFPKKQAQRLIPEYLLDYTTKLNESHPDPTESWGGASYTSGDGININDNVISVDSTIAKKSEIPTNYVTLDTEQTITMPKRMLSRLSIGDPTGDEIFIDGTYGKGQLINMYNDELGSAFCMMIDNNSIQGNTGAYFTYEDDKGLREYRLPYQDREGLTTCTLATNLDIPTKTSELTNDSGYITNITSSDITTALGYTPGTSNFSGSYNDLADTPTFATVATSGSYNDLTDKPYIIPSNRVVTTDTNQNITGKKTFEGHITVKHLTGAQTTAILPDTFDYTSVDPVTRTKSRTKFNLPISKPKGTEDEPTEYTLATTDDIPTVNNPTITFTQGGTTKGTITLNQSGDQTIEFDAGSGGGGGGTPTNMVTTDTNQDITGEKTFVGNKRIKFKQSSQYDRVGFTGFDNNDTEIGYLEMSKRDGDFTGSPISNMLGYWSNVNSAPNPSADVMLGFKYYTKDSDGNTRDYRLVVPPRYNETRATRYIPISVNGNTADNTGNINVPTETLVFTLADNSTVTVNVMTSATASTTTTLS